MSDIKKLRDSLKAFGTTPEATAQDLRLDLADLIIGAMNEKGWTQAQLAAAAGMKATFLNRVVHSSQNVTFEVAARILFALSIKPRLGKASSFALCGSLVAVNSMSFELRTVQINAKVLKNINVFVGEALIAGQQEQCNIPLDDSEHRKAGTRWQRPNANHLGGYGSDRFTF